MRTYTPSAAELWALDGKARQARQATESAYATTWYDQSGSGNPATQATSTAQPKLITAGVTELENGKPAMVFDGSDDWFDTSLSAWDGSTSFSMFAVVGDDPVSGGYITDGKTSVERIYIHALGTTDVAVGVASTSMSGAVFGGGDTNVLVGVSIPASGTSYLYDNGTQSTSGTVDPIKNNTTVLIGKRYINVNYWGGTMQEILFYPSDQSANRTGIETNINDHYGIY